MIVNLILVVKALLSYPLPFFASVELLESSLFLAQSSPIEDTETIERKRKKSISFEQPLPTFMATCYNMDGDLKYWAIILRMLLILFTLFLAIFIPHFAILMGLIGSITGTSLSLIWPCYFHLRLKKKSLRWFQVLLDVLIITIGVLISAFGVFYSAHALVRAFRHEESYIKTVTSKNYVKNNFFEIKNYNLTSFDLLEGLNKSILLK